MDAYLRVHNFFCGPCVQVIGAIADGVEMQTLLWRHLWGTVLMSKAFARACMVCVLERFGSLCVLVRVRGGGAGIRGCVCWMHAYAVVPHWHLSRGVGRAVMII